MLLLGIAGIAVVAFSLRPNRGIAGDHTSAASDEEVIGSGKPPEEGATDLSRSAKSRLRPSAPSITREETLALLQNTIIGHLEVDDESWEDCIESVNQAIRKAGVPENHLRVMIDTRDAREVGELRIRELQFRNLSLSDLLKHLCGSTKVRYRVNAGIVSFRSATTEYHEMQSEEPAATSKVLGLDALSNPEGETDPFGEENASMRIDSPPDRGSSENEHDDDDPLSE